MEVGRGKNSKVHIIPWRMPNSCFDELGLYEMTKVKVGFLPHIGIETAGALCGKSTVGSVRAKKTGTLPAF